MSPSFRPGTLADSYTVYTVFVRSLEDFRRRMNFQIDQADDSDLQTWWARRQALFEHLARTADQFWIAEEAGQAIGYARSIRREDTLELTEFFVLPGSQSAGVGRELLARAFPSAGVNHRSIVATTDARAQGRYLRAGVYARFPIYYFGRKPQALAEPSDLAIEPFAAAEAVMDDLRAIDREILGYTRAVDHAWLAQVKHGHLYRRAGRVVGYGYAEAGNGPIALLDPADYPAVLAHAAGLAAERGDDEVGFEVPLINRHAVDYLLRHGYQMDNYFAFYMSDRPLGRLENYICTSPPFFM